MISAEMKHFYVSSIDGRKRHLVAGPYATHAEALGLVDEVMRHADKLDGRAWFMAWGTAGTEEPMKTPLGPWRPPATEPTEQGLQYVMPGCEKDRTRGPAQMSFF